MKHLFWGFAALALLGCKSDTSEFPNGWLPRDETACLQAGGTVRGSRSGPICAMPTSDAGAACRDGATCEGGLCLASGMCVPDAPRFGCIDILEDGQAVTLCID